MKSPIKPSGRASGSARPLLVVLMAVVLLLAIVIWRVSNGHPARDRAGRAAAGSPRPPAQAFSDTPSGPQERGAGPRGAPYRARRMDQYWVFAPSGMTYYNHGEMDVLLDNPGKAQVAEEPIWANMRPANLRLSKSAKADEFRDLTRPSPAGWLITALVVEPSSPLKKGDAFAYDLSWTHPRVPYLHDERGGGMRLLSISFGDFPDHPRSLRAFAIPSNCTNVTTFDLAPTRVVDRPGWKVYLYDTTSLPHGTIHIAFTFGPPPTVAPPSPQDVYRMLAR